MQNPLATLQPQSVQISDNRRPTKQKASENSFNVSAALAGGGTGSAASN